MAVKFYRMRSGKVHSFSRFAYGIENNTLIPAVYAVDGDKRRYLFSDAGVGIYPVLIAGDSAGEIVSHLSQASGVRFTIRGSRIDDDDDEYAAPWERSKHRPDHSMDGFTIHCKWQSWKPTDKAIEIHDAGMDAFKNIALGVAGFFGAFLSETLSTGGPAAPSTLTTMLKIGKDVVGTAPDLYDIGQALKGGGGGAGRGRRIGLIVHYLPMNGGKDTGHTNIAAKKLARIASAMVRG